MKIITIGRSSSCDITIKDEKVSRRHCQMIQDDNGRCRIADIGSRNGTYVNEKRISGEYYLSPNDIVRIGNSRLPWQNYMSGDTVPYSPHRNPQQIENNFVVNVNHAQREHVQQGKKRATSGFGIAALILGIIGISLLAILFGAISIGRNEKCKGCGIAGLILGIIYSVIYLIIAIIWETLSYSLYY